MTHAALASTEVENKNADTGIGVPPVSIDLNQLFIQHRHHLLRFVQRYVRNANDAEDVVQNTFVEALRCASQFSGMSKPSTWLFGIALNLARNHMRCSYSHATDVLDEDVMEQVEDSHSDPCTIVELRQIAAKVGELLDELPDDIRATFEAVFDGETTYEEAAEKLDIPIGTVRSRVSRVRATVRSRCR